MAILSNTGNQDIAIGNATTTQALAPGETFDTSQGDNEGKHPVRVIRCTTAGTVTVTGWKDDDSIDLSLNAGQEILWGTWRIVAADSTFEGIIAA